MRHCMPVIGDDFTLVPSDQIGSSSIYCWTVFPDAGTDRPDIVLSLMVLSLMAAHPLASLHGRHRRDADIYDRIRLRRRHNGIAVNAFNF